MSSIKSLVVHTAGRGYHLARALADSGKARIGNKVKKALRRSLEALLEKFPSLRTEINTALSEEELDRLEKAIARLNSIGEAAPNGKRIFRETLSEAQGIFPGLIEEGIIVISQNGSEPIAAAAMGGTAELDRQELPPTSSWLQYRNFDSDAILLDPPQRAARGIHSALVIPLRICGKKVGFIYLGSRRADAFQRKQLLQTRTLADALQLLIRIEEIATLDSMTGCLNHRSYLVRVGEEIERSLRYKPVFSLLLIDVNHFKSVNDKLGQSAGDEVLRKISAKLKTIPRGLDQVARIGGDESAIISPSTDGPHAQPFAERIKKAIGEFDIDLEILFPTEAEARTKLSSLQSLPAEEAAKLKLQEALLLRHPDGGYKLSLKIRKTISIGIATYTPPQGREREIVSEEEIRSFIHRAEQALVRAKEIKDSVITV